MPDTVAKSVKRWVLLSLIAAAPSFAQFTVEGRPVQVHGFVSQGFAYSDANNYLTMDTSKGSLALTDAGVNVASQISDKFHVGAQLYVRNVGELGEGHVTLDWASGDYRFNNWLGIRAGKIKTVLGLYNDTQDAEFLHTWALLPQSVYPLDLRDSSIAHVGADLYGNVTIGKLGELHYTAYAGMLPFDKAGGYVYGLQAQNLTVRDSPGSAVGFDVRWFTPLSGLLVGTSYLDSPRDFRGVFRLTGAASEVNEAKEKRSNFYAQYTRGNLRVDAEYSREISKLEIYGLAGPYGPPHLEDNLDRRAWYAAVAYRISKRLELGTYNSRFFPDADHKMNFVGAAIPPPGRHIFDQTVSARIDLNTHLDLKLEGHFIDGYGDATSLRGFYPQENPGRLSPKTNLLIIRLGFNF